MYTNKDQNSQSSDESYFILSALSAYMLYAFLLRPLLKTQIGSRTQDQLSTNFLRLLGLLLMSDVTFALITQQRALSDLDNPLVTLQYSSPDSTAFPQVG